ncbi:UBX domain-containing protein [Delitschia confertaspora ATCC 74209]|uniref:UBX domain-containing protein n=1 Tax=Delitschia confertaspora ATCC 74209 TaxID=1513339 RepID=A0A9P4JEQ9_9PLEO|nr:UBX domain-containing protein [Delitschia confertaspora ATCC 74209]
MTDAGVDLSQLSEDHQLALHQFTAVTNQEVKDAIPILQRCQWNVQIAIARFFDGEPAEDPVAEASANIPAPQDTRRQANLLHELNTSSRSSRSRNRQLDPAPRVVPQPESQVTAQTPLLLSIIFTPFSLLYSLLSKYFRFFGYLFPFLPRLWGRLTASNINTPAGRRTATGRRPLNPRDSAARFLREFEEGYGMHSLPFFENGYAQAYDMAKKELKFLLVVLVSPEHDDTSSFIRDTLLSQEVVDFIRAPENSIILWAGNVQDSEAYQVSAALNCTKFPFAALVVHTPQVSATAMSTVARITGPTPPPQFVSKLRQAIQQHSEPLTRARAQRAEMQATRDIRQAQDSAYERSLAQDRERARKKREEAERKAREEKEAQEQEQAKEREARKLEQWRQWRASSIPSEPAAGGKDIVGISLRMPSGDRVVRKFAADAAVEELYAFVECYDILQSEEGVPKGVEEPKDFEHEYRFQLVSPMPREVYEVKAGGSIREKIGRSGNLIVERTDVEESGEEEE